MIRQKKRKHCLRVGQPLRTWNLDDEVWDATVFTKNRNRLLGADVAKEFLAHVVEQERVQGLLRMSISPSMARCWKPGREQRVFSRKTRSSHRRTIQVIPR